MSSLSLNLDDFSMRSVSPLREMAAYEALWQGRAPSFKKLADLFRQQDVLPSELVNQRELETYTLEISALLSEKGLRDIGIQVSGMFDYPSKLRDAKNPVEVLYYKGNWDLVYSPSIAVVGSRKVTEEGKARTRKLVRSLVQDNYTVVSGLASGVDSVAHQSAIDFGGKTIAVIGTPLSEIYPKTNTALQARIAKDFLVVSQVPFLKYKDQDYRANRAFFPERNITMSALTEATVIVEASDTSGTLYQARAAIAQGRKLFILDSCFKNADITWPEKFERKGAIRVKTYSDIKKHLDKASG